MYLTEDLLQFIWQFKYFKHQQLLSVDGENLQIINAGTKNTNQGPDFLNATIKVNNVTLIGSIELHINTSHWQQHQHSSDKNYNNVILHVVFKHDKKINYNNKNIATLELEPLISKILLEKYETLMQQENDLPCKSFLPALSQMGWLSWKERLATERLLQKADLVLNDFKQNNNSWEETLWQTIAYNFGLQQNTQLFKAVAQSISTQILAKHKNQIHQLEAMLLGQANLLQANDSNSYATMLHKEYLFLQKKYSLKAITIQPAFLRMRPANFPTIRLAQLAMLTHKSNHLFSVIKNLNSTNELIKLFDVVANDYWHYHYTLQDDESKLEPKQLGKQMINTIIINAIIPIVFAYGNYMNEEAYKTKAINWLQELVAENNAITKQWKGLQIENKSAFDSQALIHLTKNYCSKKMCLHCAVGNKILK